MKNILVIAPHADDECLGVGGTLLKHKANGDKVHWMLVTKMKEEDGYPADKVRERDQVIAKVNEMMGFDSFHNLDFSPTKLDPNSLNDMIGKFGEVIKKVKPEIVYLPFEGDAHTDHAMTFKAAVANFKMFRNNEIKSIRVYETPSETDYGFSQEDAPFKPQLFVDITDHIQKKLEVLNYYKAELGEFPFPRSIETVEALAKVRGGAINKEAAEAFMIVREIQ